MLRRRTGATGHRPYANNNPYKFTDPDGRAANFAVKFVVDAVLEGAIQYAETGSVDVGGALKEAGLGLLNPAKTLQKVQRIAKLADKAKDAAKGGRKGDFTRGTKREVKNDSAAANDGTRRCANCNDATTPSQKSERGVTPPGTEERVDHKVPLADGGTGDKSNAQLLCQKCHLEKTALENAERAKR